MFFAINISYSTYFVSVFPSVLFNSPAIHCLLFLYLLLSSLLAFCMLVLLTFPCFTPSSHPGTLSFYHKLQTARPKAHQSSQVVHVTQSTEPHSRGPHPAVAEWQRPSWWGAHNLLIQSLLAGCRVFPLLPPQHSSAHSHSLATLLGDWWWVTGDITEDNRSLVD
jgi:hypothetical protein